MPQQNAMDWVASAREVYSSPAGGWASGIRVLAQSSSGGSFLTGLQLAAFSLRPPKKEKARKEGGNGKRTSALAFHLTSTSLSP